MNARTFDRYGRILWWIHAVTLGASFVGALAIVATRTRGGAAPYYNPAEFLLIPSVAAIYLTLACGMCGIIHYPDHRAISLRFLILTLFSTVAAVGYLVIWSRLAL